MEEAIRGRVEEMREDLSSYKEDLNTIITNLIKQQRQLLEHKKATLEALNPKNVLDRGFTLTLDESGHPVKVKDVKVGETIKTILKDGTIESTVIKAEDK